MTTTAYAVDGNAIPEIPFDAGESYSGLLPISSNANETKKLFFWFWPSKNQSVDDEIVIWLNGGVCLLPFVLKRVSHQTYDMYLLSAPFSPGHLLSSASFKNSALSCGHLELHDPTVTRGHP